MLLQMLKYDITGVKRLASCSSRDETAKNNDIEAGTASAMIKEAYKTTVNLIYKDK